MKNYMNLLGIFGLLLLLTACTTQVFQNTTITNTSNNISVLAKGRVVMTVADAAVKLGNITSLKMTVDSVALHSNADGWINVAIPQTTYDLIALKASANQSLLTDLSLSPARYDQIRLEVSNIIVTDKSGAHQAKMPSSTLRLNGEVVVLSGKTATVSFDFIADQSLHITGNGKYIFAPVIQLESRTDANADTASRDDVRLSGGTEQTSSRVGMDVVGNLVVGGTLPPFLNINANGTISGTEDELKINETFVPINPSDLNSRITP